jgi:asparaginyl-tRNA synthetase
MQFQLEYMLRQNGQGVFYLMPTFRGEDHDQSHLNQFFHSEAELVGNLDTAVEVANAYIVYCTQRLLDRLAPELEEQLGTVAHMRRMVQLGTGIPQLRFRDACRLLGEDANFYSIRAPGVRTISRKGEQWLMKELGGFVWLTHQPANAVPFYQAVEENGEYALCADLLFGVGEVVGLGERHTNAAAVVKALEQHHVEPATYAWYVRMKQRYPLNTAGFGVGLERYLMWVLGHDDIRDIHLISRLKGITSAP